MIQKTDTNTETQPASPTAANGSLLTATSQIYDFVRRMSFEESTDAVARHQRHQRELADAREIAVREKDYEAAFVAGVFERMVSARLQNELANLSRLSEGNRELPGKDSV